MATGRELFDELWTGYSQQMSSESVSTLDFAELVTCLLFLKIDDERSQRAINPVRVVPEGLGWQSLFHRTGDVLEKQFRHVIENCGRHDPSPGTQIRQVIFAHAVPYLRCTPAALHSLMRDVIALRQWGAQGNEALHDMYALLMVEASERFQIASGQTLTPWPLVSAVIDCLRPGSSDVVLDPACGTGPFLVAAYQSMTRDEASPTRDAAGSIVGVDFDATMCRFATMNYLLSTGTPFDSPPPVQQRNSLAAAEVGAPTVIVCNPPFRSTAPLPGGRTDLWTRSGSMQLNFLQHIARSLPIRGRAAVFIPDNVLFGSGGDFTVRRALLEEFDVHTLLRLPTGVFARGGVKTNVVFFDKVRPRADGIAGTCQVWVYDFRSGLHFAARDRPLTRRDLDGFVTAFGYGRPREDRTATDKFKPVSYDELAVREFNLDILWPDDNSSEETRSPKDIALEIVDELSAALDEFRTLADELPDDSPNVGS